MRKVINCALVSISLLVSCKKDSVDPADAMKDAMFEKTVTVRPSEVTVREEVRAFLIQLRRNLNLNDCAMVLPLVCFPFYSRDSAGNSIVIDDEKKFCEDFSRIFSPKIRKLIAKAVESDEIGASSKGYNIGRGELWVSEVDERLCVHSVTPDWDAAIRNPNRVDQDDRDKNF